MKSIKRFFIVIALGAGIIPAWGKGLDYSSQRSNWGGPSGITTCGKHDSAIACIAGYNGCGNWDNGNRSSNRGTYDDEMALLILVAREINANGAKFCVTQVQGANKNKGNAWTTYYEPAGAASDCMWMCKNGYYGDECKATSVQSCISDKPQDYFSKYKNSMQKTTNAPSIEDSIPMFYWDDYRGCGVNKGQEHDMILAVIKWLDHGAIVAPVTFRAERSGWKDMVSTATLYKDGAETIVCMNGYHVNEQKNGCTATNETYCQLSNMCNDWSGFDETKHRIKSGTSCNEYRCKAVDEGFRQGTKTCTTCVQTAVRGVLEKTGECIECPTGQMFDATAASGCVAARAVSTDDLQYGPGKSNLTKLDEQCWMRTSKGDYKECVYGEALKN